MAKYLGIDGCPAGWFVTWLSDSAEDRGLLAGEIFKSFAEIMARHPDAQRILVDIPIGLLKTEDRLIESIVRKRVGPRRSSVFSVPCFDAVYAESYGEANEINRQRLGKGLSKQAWFLCPKIRQANDYLTKNLKAREIFGESHPELTFATLNGAHLIDSKKTEQGADMRRELLTKSLPNVGVFLEQCLAKYRRRDLVKDDCLDSLALLIAATNAVALDSQELDSHEQIGVGQVPIKMWLPKLSSC